MKNVTKLFTKLFCGIVIMAVFSTSAFAGHITGSFGYTGIFTPKGADTTTTVGLGTAKYLVFNTGVSSSVTTATGSFAGITEVALTDRFINPAASPQLVWTDTGGSTLFFTLLTLDIVFQDNSFLLTSGTGYVEDGAGDRTDYVWDSSYNATGDTLNFSATQASVPEPGILTLLGLGLLGLGAVKRRKLQQV